MNGTRAGFLGAVPLASSSRGGSRAARQVQAPFLMNGSSLLSSVRIGQAWPGTGALAPSAGLTKCYKCGMNPPRLMAPSTAALTPGGCVEAPASDCAAPQGGSAGTGTTPSGSGMNWADGPTEIALAVLEPTELKPYTAGADVLVQIYNIRDVRPGAPHLTEVVRGKTDAAGEYVFRGQAPAPNKDYRYRVSVSIPGGRPKKADIQARDAFAASAGNHQLSRSRPLFVVCPSNVDALVCAVAEAQVAWKGLTTQCGLAWTGSPQSASFCSDQAHAEVPLDHPKLAAHRDTFSWWVGDLGIPPKDWPDLVARFEQTMTIFDMIPFPAYPGIEDLFLRCARGVPIGQGKAAENLPITSPRLYSSTWSDYFPRTDKQIRKDMAFAYSAAMLSIFACMAHKIKQKVKETQRTLKTMSIISFATVMMNLPFLVAAGVGGIGVFATETYEFILAQQQGKQLLSQGVTASLALSLLGSGNPNFVVAALEPIINDLIKDMDPIAAQAVKAIYPQIITQAAEFVAPSAATAVSGGSNVIVSGASSFADLSGPVLSMAVKAMSMIPKLYAKGRIEELGDSLAGAEAAASDFMKIAICGDDDPETTCEEASPEMQGFLTWVVEAMGFQEFADAAIDQFLDQFQQALEAGQQQGGDVTVVPDEGGTGVSITPTDSEGTPTDAQGEPLPGGVAPESPPSGGGTIPGAPLAGGVGADIGAIAGVGGAALGLLLITGAIKFW